MTLRRLPVLPLVVLLLAADAPDAAREKEKLVGTWDVVAVQVKGQTVPAEAVKDFHFVFTADTLTRKRGEKAESGVGYGLDPSKEPKWIDMTGKTDGKQVAVPGLYKLDGDTLTLCLRADYKRPDGQPNPVQKRPESLDAGAGSENVLMTLQRRKP